ncbi:uncharacterized protein Dana_GF19547 [Drosophila ananassae]|uniref:Uncharacterized protein n=2 Tax=Drosophila ananassae TaxID=7217 RepID=B3MXZ8_DROAN|nr:uncharacterized protein Dana_GF19547 [Drosophila ananassae]
MTSEAEGKTSNSNFKLFKESILVLLNIIGECSGNSFLKLKLVELQDAIATIDSAMLLYPGSAKEKLDDLRSRSTKVHRSYSNCVNPVLLTSASVGKTLTSFLNVVDSQDLVASDEEILWSMMAQSLNNSKPNVSKSLDNLSILKTEVASLKVLFTQLRRNIEDDYTEYGTCTRAIKDLQSRDKRAHRHFRHIQEMKDFLKGLYKAALPSKKTDQTIDQGVDFLVENEPIESSEGLIKIFKSFLKRLQDKIDEANGIVDEVLRNLESFQQNFKEVAKVKSDDTFVTFLERNPGERDQLIRRMKDLDRACRVYQKLITGT